MVKSFTKSTSKIFILAILNMLVFKLSTEIDIEQVLKDIKFLNLKSDLNPTYIFTSVSIFISLTTLSMVRFFKPFIDIYLMYYLRINF